ncbi:MAG: endonuclease III [Candidatus Wildermuthbacteria bacterium]|nr:endonuclease III [Candidatus Wildermuthbacteria bacterium]
MVHAFQERKKRAQRVARILSELFPRAKIALKYSTPWELLVAVILSAQCTDKKVNEITQKLFLKYPTFKSYLQADPLEFEKDIHSCGFFRNKTKNILAAARMVNEKFGGKVPASMQELLEIPGVARKTANVVLGNAHGIIDGIAVDTHVMRLSRKLGLTDSKNPVRIEQDLMKLFPKKEWFILTYRLIEYGRQICPARKHKNCESHPLTKIYPKAGELWP